MGTWAVFAVEVEVKIETVVEAVEQTILSGWVRSHCGNIG
jgi:hypothetical protein